MQDLSASSTRDRVLSIIKREGEATVKALTEELQITPMAIRGHLNKLEKDHLIKVGNIRQKLGRPIQVFSLTEKGEACFPKRYEHFALGLLSDLQKLDDGKTLEKVILSREDRIVKERRETIHGAETPTDKMERYCAFIEQQGYMPTLEKLNETEFILNENNCALKDIASIYSFCCASELKILRSIFPEATVTRHQSQMDQNTKCVYHFRF